MLTPCVVEAEADLHRRAVEQSHSGAVKGARIRRLVEKGAKTMREGKLSRERLAEHGIQRELSVRDRTVGINEIEIEIEHEAIESTVVGGETGTEIDLAAAGHLVFAAGRRLHRDAQSDQRQAFAEAQLAFQQYR